MTIDVKAPDDEPIVTESKDLDDSSQSSDNSISNGTQTNTADSTSISNGTSSPDISEHEQNGHRSVSTSDDSHSDEDQTNAAKKTETTEGEQSKTADGESKSECEEIAKVGDKSKAEAKCGKTQELIIIQDNLYLIKINCPGLEPFEVQVSPQEMVQEIHQLLKDREDTCHRTCFSLQFNGVTMDNFSELKSIEGLKEGSEVKLIEEPYSVREARLHIRHVRELLHSVDRIDAFNGNDCSSLSYVNVVTDGDVTAEMNNNVATSGNSTPDSPTSPSESGAKPGANPASSGEGAAPAKRKKARAIDHMVEQLDCTPPDFIMPGNKDRLLTPMHPVSSEPKINLCLKVLSLSIWNPPPGNRKLHGDLLYLYVVTLEQKRFHITSSVRGFYVNQCDMETFNPKPAVGTHVAHSLIDLLGHISPLFKRNFHQLNKRRFSRHPFERIATPFQLFSWTAPSFDHVVDHVRAEDSYSSRLLFEEHIPGQQTRDWNEELSATRELARTSLPERLLRERAMFKVHSDFVAAATRGAVMVVDGNVMAINPGDARNMRMYIWNNIFFSLGFDVRDHYKDYGGHHAALYAPTADLNGVKAYGSLDVEGLHTLGTVVVDYKGYRVTAQSIIPGILEREQEQSVVYGSIDYGKSVQSHEKYTELLEKTTKQLHILPHSIENSDGDPVRLHSSLECKGIVGNDQRHYILDLLRTFPPDVNFLHPEVGYDEGEAPECQQLGLPRPHRHRLSTLRPELIDAFVDHLYVKFVRCCTSQIIAMRNKSMCENPPESADDLRNLIVDSASGKLVSKLEKAEQDVKINNNNNATTRYDQMAKWQEEAVKFAARAVGSVSDTEFDIRFNPDVFAPEVKLSVEQPAQLDQQKRMVKEAARFLVAHQIPTFIKECLEHSVIPIDGASLTDNLHEKGIGLRYLGKIVPLFSETPSLQHVYRIGMLELVARSVKHIIRPYLQEVDHLSMCHAIAHFLNCLLGSFPQPVPMMPDDELISNKKKKKARKQRTATTSGGATMWYSYTPESLWAKIRAELSEYFGYTMKEDEGIDEVVDKFGIQKMSLLRRVCVIVGIQLLVRDYAMDNRHKPPFNEDDITGVFPVVKHAAPRASDAVQFYARAQNHVQQGALREGFEMFNESLNLFTNVYGAIHSEIAACYRQIARLHYMMGEHTDAINHQLKAVIISERVLGIDHATTITDHISLALYCFACQKISASLKLLYRARYLMLGAYGYDHPEVALLDSNIGLVLHGVQEYDLSLKFLEEALKINIKYHGEGSLKCALSHHLVARAYSCKGEFRQALVHEKETYKLYKTQLGDQHDKTKESGECLRHLTQQAVTLQRTMNEIYKNGSNASFPPLQITAPSMNSVLDLMNVINGIIFIPLSQKDLEAIRQEVQKQHDHQMAHQIAANDEAARKLARKTLALAAEKTADDSAAKGEAVTSSHITSSSTEEVMSLTNDKVTSLMAEVEAALD